MNRLILAVALAGCGNATEVATYQQSIAELQTVVDAHETDSLAAPDCAVEHQRYDELARPHLRQMTRMSGGMGMGMRSMCGSMQTELDRHAAAACTGDATANHAEAQRHCQLMRDWLARQRAGAQP